jgi:hypothetical protein
MPIDSKIYPVVYSGSDTTGEKDYEEFYVSGEQLNFTRFQSLTVIENIKIRPMAEIDKLFNQLNAVFAKPDFQKPELVDIIKAFIPNFEHKERGKNLDQKM